MSVCVLFCVCVSVCTDMSASVCAACEKYRDQSDIEVTLTINNAMLVVTDGYRATNGLPAVRVFHVYKSEISVRREISNVYISLCKFCQSVCLYVCGYVCISDRLSVCPCAMCIEWKMLR